jgi:probable F420-dependent oxidoreductase
MKFGLALPLGRVEPKGFQSAATVREWSQACERAGIAAVCVSEHPAPDADWLHNDPSGHDCPDPFTVLAFAAAATTTLKVYSNILVLPYRNPFMTAKAAATLQVFSDGRFILGVGAGYQKAEFEAVGSSFHERGALTDEALETIRLVWKGGRVVKKGRYFNAPGNEARPVPNPPPPIWVGGGSDKAVERAARFGDGWLPHFVGPTNDEVVRRSSVVSMAHFSEKIARLKALRAQFGQTGPFDIVPGSPFRPKSITAADADKLLGEAQELAERGTTLMWTTLPAPSVEGFKESIAWYAEEIIAKVKA